MNVIVDAFGGDNAPLAVLQGAADAVKEYGITVTLTGSEPILRELAQKEQISLEGIELVHTDDVISMEDEARSILKAHKNSSMGLGLQLLAEGKGDAFVSAGSTAALIVGATFLVKRIKGVSRPALAPLMPAANGVFMLVDSGANVECRPEMLVQFAHMGSIYMTELFGGDTPATVGLLNVGTEETKGDALRMAAYEQLKESNLNFVGNVEARDVPNGVVDVVVADGFSGNVFLKALEGTADMLMKTIKGVFMTNWQTKLAALLVKKHLAGLKKRMDTSEYGGAPVLGVAKPVIKAHGNSGRKSIKSAIRLAKEFAEAEVVEKMRAALAVSAEEE